MDLKHGDQFLSNATVCLAEHCDVLACDASNGVLPRPCRDEDMFVRQHRCRSMFDR